MPLAGHIERERALYRRWRHIVTEKKVDAQQIHDALLEIEHEIGVQREHRHGLDHRHDLSEAQKDQRKENIADKIDDLRSHHDAVLERLDDALDEFHHAKALRHQHAKRLRQLRAKRKRIREDKQGQLTEHFHVAEFDCHDGTPVPPAAIPALKAWCENYGEPVRKAGGTVHVNSGYRTRSYNASVGGASNSVHIYDEHPGAVAVDHWCDNMNPHEVQDWHEAHTHPDGMGRYTTFTHCDNRNRIGWPDARWIGP